MPLPPVVISVEGVTKRLGQSEILSDISLQVYQQEFFGLLGPNGAGKSTLMQLISGLISPTAGHLEVLGKKPGAAKQLIGFCQQDTNLYDDMNVVENLRFFGRLYGVGGRTLDARINNLIQFFGLAPFAERSLETLSGGQKKKVNVSCALLHDPPIIILDEPTAALDPRTRRELWRLLLRLEKTVVLTTHYIEEAEFLCDRIAIINKGMVAGVDTVDNLKAILGQEKIIRLHTYPGDSQRIGTHLQQWFPNIRDIVSFHGRTIIRASNVNDSIVREIVSSMTQISERVISVAVSDPTLEDVFLYITKDWWQPA